MAQNELGLDVSIATTHRASQDTAIEEELRSAGITVNSIGPVNLPLGIHPNLRPLLAHSIAESDGIHIHGLWEDIQHKTAIEAWKQNKPYIISPHGMLTPWALSHSSIRKRLYISWRLKRDLHRATAMHFTTPSEARLSRETYNKRASIIEPLGVFMHDLVANEDRTEFRKNWEIPNNRFIIAFMGRIHPGKGLEYLLPALSYIQELNPLLLVIGPDSRGFKSQIEDIIRKFALERNVVFTGILSGGERNAALTASDIFALPSDHENFGLAVIEAMGCGLPVLISPEVAIGDYLKDSDAVTISERNPRAIAMEISNISNNRNRLAGLGSQASTIARDRFSWRSIAINWKQHWEKITNK